MPTLMTGAVLGFFSVALGAFGAHGLASRLTPEGKGWWETATLYALVHAAAITAAGIGQKAGVTGLSMPSATLAIGTLVFSGSLYAMALGAPRWFGAITPLGGLALLAGWALFAFIGLKG
jgi:uncharacterized membrane protein YgdD (TMEM256/DUF423 family)